MKEMIERVKDLRLYEYSEIKKDSEEINIPNIFKYQVMIRESSNNSKVGVGKIKNTIKK